MSRSLALLSILLVISVNVISGYTIPKPTFVAYSPSGLSVSIPDDDFTIFSFHAKINEKTDETSVGYIAVDNTMLFNGSWNYMDEEIKLEIGDKIHYSTFVIKDGRGYGQDNGVWTVTELLQGKSVATTARPGPMLPEKFIIERYLANTNFIKADNNTIIIGQQTFNVSKRNPEHHDSSRAIVHNSNMFLVIILILLTSLRLSDCN